MKLKTVTFKNAIMLRNGSGAQTTVHAQDFARLELDEDAELIILKPNVKDGSHRTWMVPLSAVLVAEIFTSEEAKALDDTRAKLIADAAKKVKDDAIAAAKADEEVIATKAKAIAEREAAVAAQLKAKEEEELKMLIAQEEEEKAYAAANKSVGRQIVDSADE